MTRGEQGNAIRPRLRQFYTKHLFPNSNESPLRLLSLPKHWSNMDFEAESSQNTGYILNESLIALNKAWSTETNALEILPFNSEIVQELQEQLEEQQVWTVTFIENYTAELALSYFSTLLCLAKHRPENWGWKRRRVLRRFSVSNGYWAGTLFSRQILPH